MTNGDRPQTPRDSNPSAASVQAQKRPWHPPHIVVLSIDDTEGIPPTGPDGIFAGTQS